MKKKIKNNAWNIRHLVCEPFVPGYSKPAYYIVDCWIFIVIFNFINIMA